jgi:hypothetical protein
MDKFSKNQLCALILLAILGFAAGCGDESIAMSVEVDPGIAPAVRHWGGDPSSPLARVTSNTKLTGDDLEESGDFTDFVANEVVFCPIDVDDLEHLLDQTGAVLVGSDEVPVQPGPNPVSRFTEAQRAARCFTLKLDADALPLQSEFLDVPRDTDRASVLPMHARVSSELGSKLLAFAAREQMKGRAISANWVAYGAEAPALLHTIDEREKPDGSGPVDVMSDGRYRAQWWDGPGTSESGVAKAMQYLGAQGFDNQVRVAVIDGGFYIQEVSTTSSGRPFDRILSTGLSDFRTDDALGRGVPLQWDWVEGDAIVDGVNGAACTGGNPCPWHGRNNALVAAGWANNGFGQAGSGGLAGVPILLNTDLKTGQIQGAIRMAADWGATVANLSFGFGCDNVFCEIGIAAINYEGAFNEAYEAGTFIVAAAGNNDVNNDESQKYPCGFTNVFCVGALENGRLKKISYSNYGNGRVDLFAPTNITMRVPSGPADSSRDVGPYSLVEGSAGGTSAASPFVAGVAAMMRALDSTLRPADVRRILRETAWGPEVTEDPSSDCGESRTEPCTAEKVDRALNALEAIRRVAGYRFPLDELEPNDNESEAILVDFSETENDARRWDELTFDEGRPIVEDGTNYPRDADVFLIRLDDWARVNVSVEHLTRMSDIGFDLRRVGTSGSISFTASGDSFTSRFASFDELAPADYVLTIRGSGQVTELLYNLTFEKFRVATPFGPDRFEVNDEISDVTSTYGSTGRGSWRVTHHPDAFASATSTDVDHYRFHIDSVGPADPFNFLIRSTDYPVSLVLYEKSGAGAWELVDGDGAPQTGGVGLGYRLENGEYIVRVVSEMGLANRYTFTAAGAVPASGGPGSPTFRWLEDHLYDIARASSIDWTVINMADYVTGIKPPGADELVVNPPDAMVRLYDPLGNLLSEGLRAHDAKGEEFRRVSMKDVADGARYVLEITREGFEGEAFRDRDLPEMSIRGSFLGNSNFITISHQPSAARQ